MSTYLPEDNLSYPVLIKTDQGSGSGFFFNHLEKTFYLVTAKHVLFNVETSAPELWSQKINLVAYDKDCSKSDPIEIVVDLSMATIKSHPHQDIVLVEIANVVDDAGFRYLNFAKGSNRITTSPSTIVGVPNGSLKKIDEVSVSNGVFIIGYPNSLSFRNTPQIDFERPLLRKGVIAGKNSKNSTIILDCPSYQGNSGGIAIEVDEEILGQRRFRIIGIVSQFIPFVEQLKSMHFGYTNLRYENSGYSVVVPIDAMLDLVSDEQVGPAQN